MALRSDIFQRDSLSGTTTVRNGFANVIVDVGPYGLTGNINFIVELRRGSIAGEVLAATPPINLVDYSELVSFAPNVAIISEGEDVRFDLLTANLTDGSTFYYTANAISGNVDAEDFISEITGSIIVYNNQANILISSNSIPTIAVETGEVFDVQLRLGSVSGEVSRTSNVVEILDTANLVDVTALSLSSNVIFESESVVLTIDTVNALGTNSKILYYTVTGNADIYSDTSGSFLVGGNQANLEFISEASVPDNETREFAVEIRRTSISGPILSTSENISVNAYTGTADSKISLVANVTTSDRIYVDETATIRVQTINVVSDETMYYNILGVSNAEIIGGNTGSLVVTSNNNSEFPITFNLAPLDQANAVIQIRRNSNDGALLGVSNAIPIVPREVSGGLVVDEGTDLVHIFLSTANLVVSSEGAGIQANLLLVAGGGGSGGSYGGGGGAGGMLEVPVVLSQGEYVMEIGAGGAGFATGNPSSGLGTTVIYGGRGAYSNSAGTPGGSGGGGGGTQTTGAGAGTGTPGQGNPGSNNPPGYFGGNGYSGAGGGAGGGGGGAPSFTGGPGRISTISPENYGTNISNVPTPGGDRYFSGGGCGSNGSNSTAVGGRGGGGNAKSNGQTNTGGGGGGNPWKSGVPTTGGSGIIMVRYPKP